MSTTARMVTVALLLFTLDMVGQHRYAITLTYSQSTFLYAPGITWSKSIGESASLYAGAGLFFQKLDPDRVINSTYMDRFNFQHIDLGFGYNILTMERWAMGLSVGVKAYYSPHYLPVAVYQQTGKAIYYDASGLRPAFGADLGITVSYHRLTTLLKYDTARKQFRTGLGYRFGSRRE
jgi:hypothetical protein